MQLYFQKNKLRSTQQGLSLVELLVVFGLIALLSVLVHGTIFKSLDAAKRAQCISNLRTCGQGIFMHASENNNFLVLPWASATERDLNDFPHLRGHPQSGKAWHEYLANAGYFSAEATVCPSFAPYKFSKTPWGQAYGMRRSNSSTRYSAIKPASIDIPSKYLLLADSSRPSEPPRQWYYITWPGNNTDRMHFRHQSKANALFLDGSVRPVTSDEVLNLDDGWREQAFDLSM